MRYKGLETVNKLSNKLIFMEYKEDYILDKLLSEGVNSDSEINGFVEKYILNGEKTEFTDINMGCSAFLSYLNDKGDLPDDERDAMKVLMAAVANTTRRSAVYNQSKCSLLLSAFKNYENLYEFKL